MALVSSEGQEIQKHVQEKQCTDPTPDFLIDNVQLKNCKDTTFGTRVDCQGNFILNTYLNLEGNSAEPATIHAIKNALVKGISSNHFLKQIIVISVYKAWGVPVPFLCSII